MSGVFGMLGGLFGGGNTQAGASGLLSEVMNAAGGPAGIMQKFQQAGMGEKVQSWIGDGHNLPVSAEQIAQVFPPQQLDAWAQKHGLPAGAASQVLAEFLPHAVDHTTPDGTLPPPGTTTAPTDAASGTAPGTAPGGFDFSGLLSRLTADK